jgi:hypothetical protein
MEGKLTLFKALKYVLFVLIVIACLGSLWWFYGEPLSEESSYELAINHVNNFANKNHIDLSLYYAPNIKHQKSEIYTFEWAPKGGGEPLTVVVDPMRVEVYMDN